MHHRKSIRLKGYDYRENGAYFITIVVQKRESLLGEVIEDEMFLSEAGEMIAQWYDKLADKFIGVVLVEMVIMPNHIHFILNKETQSRDTSLSKIIQWFKTMTTNAYIKGVKEERFEPFDKRLWQRNYYEHIIRNEASFHRLMEYIQNNPKTWKEDSLNE